MKNVNKNKKQLQTVKKMDVNYVMRKNQILNVKKLKS